MAGKISGSAQTSSKTISKFPCSSRISSRLLLGATVASFLLWSFDTPVKISTLASDRLGYQVCSETNSIYTVDEAQPQVECISVKGSIISDVGSLDEIENRWISLSYPSIPSWALRILHRRTRVFRLDRGAIVVPGLADAHAHVLEYGYMMQLPLSTTASIDEIVRRTKEYVLAHPDVHNDRTRWIEGMGWDQTKWDDKQFPTAADLDSDPLLEGRPISLSRVDGHARWVSSRVLELMGDLPDEVEGGQIIRNRDGKPTGIFVDNAMSLIPTPPWSDKLMSQFFDTAMTDALSHGLTSIHDADSKPDHIAFFQKKAEKGDLPNRLYLMGNVQSDVYWGSRIPRLTNYGKHGRLNIRSVKLFADGALGSWGAALREPYSDKPETQGLLITPPEVLANLTHQFWKDGFQVNIHCIGDRANEVVLDIFEDILESRGGNVTEWQPRIEHAQIFAPADLERIGRLGVIPSVQPTHATSDMPYAQSRLGPERILGAYAYQTLLKASPEGVLPLGSDFPVESINPLLGFYAAVSRLNTHGTSPHGTGGWFPEQRLSRAQALKGMTLDAAYASFAENTLGSLTPGKKADFVVLDRDIMTVPFADILKTKVGATVVDGEVAYGAL
ncbi:putative amidohydrolase YtcJ [Hypsizygus marmoreus]|uniref:Amidohydrolase YtcJ n=1 Tax=Hypsizygus marmoreus TaxID=39966 RepID=A0A369JRU7_HYPMA|nr:putative amidohydrolase YtcJ [Hypsizygus marmoreus]